MIRNAKLLVVEDQANERRAMARLLRMEGYEALTAQNAGEALDRLSEPVALVITDLKMPDASGVELLRRWKAERPATPFIMVTAYADVPSAVEAMKLGAMDYLTKPIDPEALLQLVARAVAEHGSVSADRDAPTADGPPPPLLHAPGDQRAKRLEALRLEDLEKEAVLRALERKGGNRTHAAEALGISIRTLQRKLKAWGLGPER